MAHGMIFRSGSLDLPARETATSDKNRNLLGMPARGFFAVAALLALYCLPMDAEWFFAVAALLEKGNAVTRATRF